MSQGSKTKHSKTRVYTDVLSVCTEHALEWCCAFHEHVLMVSDRYSQRENEMSGIPARNES